MGEGEGEGDGEDIGVNGSNLRTFSGARYTAH